MPLAFQILLVPVALVLVAALTRRLPVSSGALSRFGSDRWAPLGVGLLTAAFSLWAWGSLDAQSAIHDEAAYLLQARIFATGHWSMPSPPLPEFFQQYHVLLTPRLAPKYWPGHGLLLVPGVVLDLPALMPVLMTGRAGGLLFALGRRLAGTAASAIGVCLWLTAPGVTVWRTTYLPVTSSTALWLAGALFLLRWWERGRCKDLVALSMCASSLAVTRPLTAVAFALPTLFAVLTGMRRRRSCGQLPSAFAAGLFVLGLVPIWSSASTGDWRKPPYLAYRTIPDAANNLVSPAGKGPSTPFVPEDFREFASLYRPLRSTHTLVATPRILVERVERSFLDLFSGARWRLGLLPLFLLGVVALEKMGRFALAWPLALYLSHLPRPHFTPWSVYYVETLGILAVATGAGVVWLFQRVSSRERGYVHVAAIVALALALVGDGLRSIPRAKRQLEGRRAYFSAFQERLDALPPGQRSVIFIRYAEGHNVHNSLIRNPPDYTRARHWLVYDRGAENEKLLAVAGERVPYLFDEGTFRLSPMSRSPDDAPRTGVARQDDLRQEGAAPAIRGSGTKRGRPADRDP